MKCLKCQSDFSENDSRVINSRSSEKGIRRRRECQVCQYRFTTYEEFPIADVELTPSERWIKCNADRLTQAFKTKLREILAVVPAELTDFPAPSKKEIVSLEETEV